MQDEKAIARLLMFIAAEAATLRAEIDAIAGELHDEDRLRFDGTLQDIQRRSEALLSMLPGVVVN